MQPFGEREWPFALVMTEVAAVDGGHAIGVVRLDPRSTTNANLANAIGWVELVHHDCHWRSVRYCTNKRASFFTVEPEPIVFEREP